MMTIRKKERPFYQRILIDILGFSLMIIAPLLGWLPGPGGIPLFVAGLGLVSLNHEWAENLLKDFDKKRVAFTDKVLLASPRISKSIDVLCIGCIALGVYLASTQDSFIFRAIGLGTVSLSLLVIFSNQKRFERLSKAISTRLKQR